MRRPYLGRTHNRDIGQDRSILKVALIDGIVSTVQVKENVIPGVIRGTN